MPRQADPTVVVFGAACVDIKGRASVPLTLGTSNQGLVRVACGGAGRNIAENLARLGVSTTLLSVVGTDSYAHTILEETAAAGVNVDYLRVASGVSSALYLAVLDQHGHLSVSVGEMTCLELINPPYIYAHRELIDAARMVVVDANLSTAALGTIVALAKRRGVPVCMATVASALAPKAKRYLREYHIVIGNADEASALCGVPITGVPEATAAAHQLVATGVKLAIITLGARGLVYASGEGSGFIPSIQTEVLDTTGAGDALTAAVIYGHINKFPVDEALRLGVSAATLTLACRDTVCQDLNQETLYQRMVI
ncbi:MAG: carbohydrate kinase family protein [Chloroflexota bacterium]